MMYSSRQQSKVLTRQRIEKRYNATNGIIKYVSKNAKEFPSSIFQQTPRLIPQKTQNEKQRQSPTCEAAVTRATSSAAVQILKASAARGLKTIDCDAATASSLDFASLLANFSLRFFKKSDI